MPGLTPEQRQNLRDWGHSYVMGEFRFRMTLTGWLPAAERIDVEKGLVDLFVDVDLASVSLDAITVFEQPDPASPFRLTRSFALGSESG